MAKLISKTYGDALFELALETDKLDTLQEEVEAVREVLHTNQEFIKFMCHPRISTEEKNTVITNVFEGKVSEELTGFFLTVQSKGRFSEIDNILSYFVDRCREYKKIGVAYVTSAVPLKDSEKKAVEDRLLETTDYKSFLMNYEEDASLIGGMVIRIGGRVVDSSVKTKLNNMAKSLAAMS
jgi:F-type H+-transporting ATPase subunit delta